MSKVAIKGHLTRGKEVIEILEMLGGKNACNFIGACNVPEFAYSINEQEIIDLCIPYPNSSYAIFTLEEFLEKYPYKVGNKVDYIKYDDDEFCVYEIIGMVWTGNAIEYTLDSFGFTCLTKDIRLHKEKNMNRFKSLNVETYLKVWDETENGLEVCVAEGYEMIEKNGQFYIVKQKINYPMTCAECCDILGIEDDLWFSYEDIDNNHINPTSISDYRRRRLDLYHNFEKLRICRDAYWKIAGKQMDLGKPWEPDYTDDIVKYIIGVHRNHLDFNITIERNYILIFPTEEMRDAFYENFKDLIEACKEFL